MEILKKMSQNLFFWTSIIFLGISVFIWFKYAVPQREVDKNYKTYIQQAKDKQTKRKLANNEKVGMIPLDKGIGDIYIQAYVDSFSSANENYMGVEIDKTTLDFFSGYLSGDSSIGIKFAIYDYAKLSASTYKDPTFEERLKSNNPDKKIGLMFGVMKKGEGTTFKPFTISKLNPFYDDWNNEWPPHN